ncbi:transcriptional regulator [Candidatus Magnetomorum sp. HK-1]|nr:transcriptional regulator [Candidatus Magnetomorum sp. HK-1]
MPEISSFYGIAITMNYKEHNPPHFHAAYQDYEVSVEIKTGIVKGKMPKRALKMIFEWLENNQEDLLNNWNLAQERKALEKITPLP